MAEEQAKPEELEPEEGLEEETEEASDSKSQLDEEAPATEKPADVPDYCLEFAEREQNCTAFAALVQPLSELNSDIFPEMIDLPQGLLTGRFENLTKFKDGAFLATLVAWGNHGRVLFKATGGGLGLVDPWKPATKVKIPKVIEEVFGVRPAWINRGKEQCRESSCTYIALARAIVIAASPENTVKAAQNDIRYGVGPYAAAVVKLLTYARDAKHVPSVL